MVKTIILVYIIVLQKVFFSLLKLSCLDIDGLGVTPIQFRCETLIKYSRNYGFHITKVA